MYFAPRGETWGGVWGVWHPPPPPQNTNHLVCQGESSGLAGQSKVLNDRINVELLVTYRAFRGNWIEFIDLKFTDIGRIITHVLTGICTEKLFWPLI
jgi:hypothetical protein